MTAFQQLMRKTLMKKLVVFLAASAVVSGCATSRQQIESHAPALNSWVGAPIEEFVDMQGAPTAVEEKDDYQLYRFDAYKRRSVTHTNKSCAPTNFNEPIDDYGRPAACSTAERHWYTATFTCRYGLAVVEDVIRGWNMIGNNCRMMTIQNRPRQSETG